MSERGQVRRSLSAGALANMDRLIVHMSSSLSFAKHPANGVFATLPADRPK
jgi:hypothetical protein